MPPAPLSTITRWSQLHGQMRKITASGWGIKRCLPRRSGSLSPKVKMTSFIHGCGGPPELVPGLYSMVRRRSPIFAIRNARWKTGKNQNWMMVILGQHRSEVILLGHLVFMIWQEMSQNGSLDVYSEDFYSKSPRNDPVFLGSGEWRVTRGGGWNNGIYGISSVVRSAQVPSDSKAFIGFRCVKEAP
jgi:hypothetical protein